jgi:hypothetical protein
MLRERGFGRKKGILRQAPMRKSIGISMNLAQKDILQKNTMIT